MPFGVRYILPSSGVRWEAPAAGARTPKFGANRTENQTDDDGVEAGAEAPASRATPPDGDDVVDDTTPAAAGSAEGAGSLPPLVNTGRDLAPAPVAPTSAGVAAVKVDDERSSVAADATVGAESPAEAEVEEAEDAASRRRLWR